MRLWGKKERVAGSGPGGAAGLTPVRKRIGPAFGPTWEKWARLWKRESKEKGKLIKRRFHSKEGRVKRQLGGWEGLQLLKNKDCYSDFRLGG